ncbi:MAG: hypothetical protein K8L97_21975 [Anaerolineae bacterium]|nr:hypothetical protein [Anaerolineae bacterium]
MSIEILLLFRAVHIVAGALWAGTAIFYFFLVEPAAKTLGPDGPKFMQALIQKRRYPLYMNVSSALTIVAGALLYWNMSGGLQLLWIQSGPGLGFTIGSIAAIGAYLVGFFMLRPRGERLGKLGQQITMSGSTPDPAQAAELQKLDQEIRAIERFDVILLTISLLTMATARYWVF